MEYQPAATEGSPTSRENINLKLACSIPVVGRAGDGLIGRKLPPRLDTSRRKPLNVVVQERQFHRPNLDPYRKEA